MSKHKAEGGKVEEDGGNPYVFKEAKERKFGGRAKGPSKGLGAVGGAPAKMNLGRPGRKTGGRVGADKSPLSSAHNASASEKTG